jgi:ABC-type histidine transport system ATPase subunit
LVRCINHLEVIDSGSILIDRTHILPDRLQENGKKLSPRGIARFRTRIGMVFQNFNLFPHLTVLGNVIEAPTGVLRWSRDQAVAQAMALLTRVGLADKADAYPATLSGGQQQRAAIVRALIMDPPIMLFDEPTSALDPHLTDEVLTVIRDLAIRNRTSIIVTHEMEFARNVASDVVVMADGRIIEQGPPDAIFGAPRSMAARQLLKLTG